MVIINNDSNVNIMIQERLAERWKSKELARFSIESRSENLRCSYI